MWPQLLQSPLSTEHHVDGENRHNEGLETSETHRPASSARDSSDTAKLRLKRACDSCSSRKIKCGGSQAPCEPCKALQIPCTFKRPTRRRGPVNKYAVAPTPQNSTESPPTTVYTEPIRLKSVAPPPPPVDHPSPALLESICDIATIQILVDQYFTFIHPIIPLPHEPTFRAALTRRDDRVDRGFVALLASMIEVLVASFPRRPLEAITLAQAKYRYPTAGALIDQCHKVFNEARGLGFNDREACLNDALCSYLAGLAAGYVFDLSRQRRYLSECVVILRTLGFHRSQFRVQPGTSVDHVYQQSGRRLFWLCFVGSMSVRQLGSYDSDILMPPTAHAEQLPPLPVQVDDAYIYPSHIFNQPAEMISLIHGFNLNVRLFRSFHSLITLELVFGGDTIYDWNRQRKLIRRALTEVKAVTQDVPQELQLPQPVDFAHFYEINNNSTAPYDGGSYPSNPSNINLSETSQPRSTLTDPKRKVQFEIQKANIYATQLATRSFLVEKFWNLFEIQEREHTSPPSATIDRPTTAISPTAECIVSGLENRYHQSVGTPSDMYLQDGEQAMAIERENIVRDMALLLKNINQVDMEPNGLSFCNKIRQVASTLLNQDRMRMSVMPSLDTEAVNEYLIGFCDILAKLERLGPGRIRNSSEDGRTTQDAEEEALVHWASLREHQERFIRSEGFLANANV